MKSTKTERKETRISIERLKFKSHFFFPLIWQFFFASFFFPLKWNQNKSFVYKLFLPSLVFIHHISFLFRINDFKAEETNETTMKYIHVKEKSNWYWKEMKVELKTKKTYKCDRNKFLSTPVELELGSKTNWNFLKDSCRDVSVWRGWEEENFMHYFLEDVWFNKLKIIWETRVCRRGRGLI